MSLLSWALLILGFWSSGRKYEKGPAVEGEPVVYLYSITSNMLSKEGLVDPPNQRILLPVLSLKAGQPNARQGELGGTHQPRKEGPSYSALNKGSPNS